MIAAVSAMTLAYSANGLKIEAFGDTPPMEMCECDHCPEMPPTPDCDMPPAEDEMMCCPEMDAEDCCPPAEHHEECEEDDDDESCCKPRRTSYHYHYHYSCPPAEEEEPPIDDDEPVDPVVNPVCDDMSIFYDPTSTACVCDPDNVDLYDATDLRCYLPVACYTDLSS